MADLISIIMPVKNGIPYLNECIQSIINQSYTNWELLVVNDHSSDDTQTILDHYSNIDPRVKPIQNRGTGIIHALRLGYARSNGAYLTRMDADDIMPSKKLAKLYNAIKNKNTPCLSTGYVSYFSELGVKDGYKNYESWLNSLCDKGDHFKNIYKECVIPSPCWMMRRDHFDKIGGFEIDTYPEDYDLSFRMYQNNIEVIPVCEILHLWRDHSSRTSRNDDNYADNRFLELKLDYFKKLEVHKRQNITIIGAGKKGKTIARFLIQNEIQFQWITNNPKKIGIDIYGIILTDYAKLKLDNETSYIISTANKIEQEDVRNKLSEVNQNCVYYFC